MIRSFSSAGLTLLTLGMGLGLYLVSYSVAAERGKIESLERKIANDMRIVQSLEAELRVRASLPQLERWNSDVLALSAPAPRQILESDVQLAALMTVPERNAPAVHLASVQKPQAPAGGQDKSPVQVAVYTALAVTPVVAKTVALNPVEIPSVAQVKKVGGLFSEAFVAEINNAAANERAMLSKVSLR